MKSLWKYISKIGINPNSHDLNQRSNMLFNQINGVLFAIMLLIFTALRIEGALTNAPIGFGSIRVLIIMLITLLNLILSYYKYFSLAKFILIYLTPFIIIVLPTLNGFVEEESYIYYQYGIICLSIIPQLILRLDKKKYRYYIALLIYGILILTIDNILNHFNPNESQIYKSISEFYFIYKFIPFVIFMFTSFAIFYLRKINFTFEQQLEQQNQTLDIQNEELKSNIDYLKETQTKLVHAEKMAALGNLTAGISHEINNPLNYIQGGVLFINNAIDDLKNSKLANDNNEPINYLNTATEVIEKGLQKAANIVNLLTVFSLKKSEHKTLINLNEIINGTLCFIDVKTNNKFQIAKDLTYNGDVKVFHDQIHQVVLNIFNNAIEAINANNNNFNAEIKIKTTTSDNGFVLIDIFNSGPQINENDLLRIFEPFYSTKETTGKSGLGLSIAFSIIQDHNGNIEAVNRPNGVSFIIKLPIY